MARGKQALTGTIVSAVATMGRVEIRATWAKDPRRPILVYVHPGDLWKLEAALKAARAKLDTEVPKPVKATKPAKPAKAKATPLAPTTTVGKRIIKTIADI